MKNAMFLWFLLLPLCIMAQLKYDANWTYGVNGGMTFDANNSPASFKTLCNNIEANASISDSSGELLLYLALWPNTASGTIRNKNNVVIFNGSDIIADPSASNGALFLPSLSNPNELYLFYIGKDGSTCNNVACYKTFYTRIIKQPLGDWQVIEKNIALGNEIVEESITAIKNADASGWWILAHEQREIQVNATSNNFIVYLFKDTIEKHLVSTQNVHKMLSSPVGDIVPFENGNKFLEVVAEDNIVFINQFDRCEGNIYSKDSISISLPFEYLYSAAVVEDYIYVSYLNALNTLGTGGILQYKMAAGTITGPVIIFQEQAQGYYQGQLELGPDGNIWVSHGYYGQDPALKNKYQKHLSVILNADSDSALYTPYYFYIGDSAENREGLPNFPNYNLGPEGVFLANAGKDTVLCSNTNSTGVSIGSQPTPNVTYLWQPAAGLSANNIAQPTANPNQSTWYYLTATDTNATSCAVNTDSVYVKVETCTGINETPAAERWDYRLKPNLFNSGKTATINLAIEETGTVEIYNIQGALVGSYEVEQGKNVLTLDKALTSSGVYIYKVYTGNQLRHTDKLVVVE